MASTIKTDVTETDKQQCLNVLQILFTAIRGAHS